MGINNKYRALYERIIDKAQSEVRLKGDGMYYERHHIIPKSMGGNNLSDNLVLLTGREHFLCHYLLTKFTEGDSYKKMSYAFFQMGWNKSGNRYMNSRLYENNKTKLAIIKRDNNLGKTHSDESKIKMSLSKVGKYVGLKHPMYGKTHSNYSKDKIKKARLKQRGINHPSFVGYYITPWGIFTCIKLATVVGASKKSINNWCRNVNTVVTCRSYSHSKYLKSLSENPVGKTFKDLGFYFVSKEMV